MHKWVKRAGIHIYDEISYVLAVVHNPHLLLLVHLVSQ